MNIDAEFVLSDTAVGVVYGTLPWILNTTHGLRCLHRCFAAIRAAFADVYHVFVTDDAGLAAAAAAADV